MHNHAYRRVVLLQATVEAENLAASTTPASEALQETSTDEPTPIPMARIVGEGAAYRPDEELYSPEWSSSQVGFLGSLKTLLFIWQQKDTPA